MPLYPNNKEKVERTEKATVHFESIGREKTKGKLLPPGLERQTSDYRESLLVRSETQAETTVRTSSRVGSPTCD